MESIYRDIIKKSWRLMTKYKWMWFFGLFVAFMGNGGEIDVLLQYKKLTDAPNFLLNLKTRFAGLDLGAANQNFLNSLADNTFWTIASIAFVLIVLLLIIWLVTVSQGGIIYAASKSDGDKSTNFKQSLRKGQQKFWPIFGLNIITRFILYFILIILAMPFAVLYMLNDSPAALMFITLLAFILLVPTAIILYFILKYAFAYVIIKNQRAGTAFLLAWRLFVKNWLISIEMAIALFAINVAVGFTMIFLLMLLSLPFIGLLFVAMWMQSLTGFNIVMTFGIIVGVSIILITGAGLGTFQYTAWTLLWQKLQTGKKYPKLIRLIAGKKKPAKT